MSKLVEMKIKRLEREHSVALTDDEFKRSHEMVRDHIKTFKQEGANFIFFQHPTPRNIQDAVTCDMDKVVGYVDDWDEDYAYCRIFERYSDDISDEKVRATALYLAAINKETKKNEIRRIARLELKVFDDTIPKL